MWAVDYPSLSRLNASQVYDPAVHPADVTLNWVECDGIYDCAAAPAVLQPVITCEGEMWNTLCSEHSIR